MKVNGVRCRDEQCPLRSCWVPADVPLDTRPRLSERACLTRHEDGCPVPLPSPWGDSLAEGFDAEGS